jgi:CRISPR/Cas system CSM-associated protein Csm3 (group 7 of RAMP superfamily)
MNAPEFESRWLVRGTLKTQSELHIGDGGSGEIHERAKPKQGEEEVDASTVCTDHRGTCYVPGSSIKGALRALVENQIKAEGEAIRQWSQHNRGGEPQRRPAKPATPWSDLLGSDSPEAAEAVGGKLEFWDAFHSQGAGIEDEQPNSTLSDSDDDIP